MLGTGKLGHGASSSLGVRLTRSCRQFSTVAAVAVAMAFDDNNRSSAAGGSGGFKSGGGMDACFKAFDKDE